MEYPILVINLNRSEDRLANATKQLGDNSFIRIEGIDGREWESGELDKSYRPMWKPGVKKKLREQKILGDIKVMELTPCEVACALSHKKAWEYIVEKELECAIILEDDFELTKNYKKSFHNSIAIQKIKIEEADVVFLFGKETDCSFLKLDPNNRILSGQCNVGYLITLEGAKKAIKAQFPMYMACDMQWWRVAFKDIEGQLMVNPVERGYAYAMKKSIITTDSYTNLTTMTPSGKKNWQIKKE